MTEEFGCQRIHLKVEQKGGSSGAVFRNGALLSLLYLMLGEAERALYYLANDQNPTQNKN